MKKGDKYSLGYAIGSSIQENKDKIAKLEKKVENLKNKNQKLQQQLEEQNKMINEILNNTFFANECPYSLIGDGFTQELCDCDNCEDNYKKCWIKYFKNKILERGKNGK